jgi:hypothetical protein
LLIVSNNPPARACAKNLRRHSRISTLRAKVELLGLQAYQNLKFSERSQMTHIVRETPRNRLNQCDNTLLDSAPKLSFWPLAIAAAVFAVLLAFAMMR